MRTISTGQIVTTLTSIVNSKPVGYRYSDDYPDGAWNGCRYVHTNTRGTYAPACLMGVLAHRLGATLDDLSLADPDSSVQHLFEDLGWRVEDAAVMVLLRLAQAAQDTDVSWRLAIQPLQELGKGG